MEYHAIFEINTGMHLNDDKISSYTRYETSRFDSKDIFTAMLMASYMARQYARAHPLNPGTRTNIVKIVQLNGPQGHINQKHAGISGLFEDNCMIIKYSHIDKFMDCLDKQRN
jgi:hypothetical protein